MGRCKKQEPTKVWERQKDESAQAFEAFVLYRDMGTERSIRAVSQKLGKSKTLIERWSREKSWVERVRAWDNYLQKEAQKVAIKKVRDMNTRHANMACMIQKAAMAALQKWGPDMVTPKNFSAIVKLATELERQSRTASAAAADEKLDVDNEEEKETIHIYLPDNGRLGDK